MEKRRCLYCNGPIPEHKRADSKFCKNSCKAWYWEKHKAEKQKNKAEAKPESIGALNTHTTEREKSRPLEGLRGVINNTPIEEVKQESKQTAVPSGSYPSKADNDCLPTDEQVENPEYKKLMERKAETETEIKKEEGYLLRFDEDIKKVLALQAPANGFKFDRDYKTSSDTYLLKDLLFGDEAIENSEGFEQEKKNRLRKLAESKAQCQKMLEHNRGVLQQINEALAKTPHYKHGHKSFWERMAKIREENKKSKVEEMGNSEHAAGQNEIKQDETQAQQTINTNTMNENETAANTEDNAEEILKNYPWIINSQDISKIKYSRLNFQGKWKDFLGQPGTDFHMAVHGASGQGKSTLCFYFAKYLAVNFGRVIYFANEEPTTAVTFDEKMNLVGAKHPKLHFINIAAHENIMERVPAGVFHFIFIDSLNTLGITPQKLRELKSCFQGSAFITISRETKQTGQLRGSGEIIYDADIVVEVDNKVGRTTKNRFKECDMEYVILPPSNNSNNEKGKPLTPPKNVI